MSQALIDKLKKSRETSVVAGDFTFKVKRPTDMEFFEMRDIKPKQGDVMRRFVVGWSGVLESHIIPGGTSDPVPFDSSLFMEWVEDQPDLWAPLTDAIIKEYEDHFKKVAEKLGEPKAGSNAKS